MNLSYTLSEIPGDELFDKFKYMIIAEYDGRIENEVSDTESSYCDIIIGDIKVTLHQNIYTGIEIFMSEEIKPNISQVNLLASLYIYLKYSNPNFYTRVVFKNGNTKEIIYLNNLILNIKKSVAELTLRYFKEASDPEIKRDHCSLCDKIFSKNNGQATWNSLKYSICSDCADEFIFNDHYLKKLEQLPAFIESIEKEKIIVENTCACTESNYNHENFVITSVGIDQTGGRYGEVSLQQCKICQRNWLHYFYESASISKSGRWYRTIISDKNATEIDPEKAITLLEKSNWYLYGGSYYSGIIRRSKGKIYL